MAFNYAKEKRDFDREWSKLRDEYKAVGMTTADIEELYKFDLNWFCSRRRFMNHTQSLPAEVIEGEDSREQSSLLRKFAAFSVSLNESAMGGRYGWMEEIDNPRLLDKLRKLSHEDLELLTLLSIDGYTQTEIALSKGCSQNAISKKYLRIKKVLK